MSLIVLAGAFIGLSFYAAIEFKVFHIYLIILIHVPTVMYTYTQ
jgi:hypothetical protein